LNRIRRLAHLNKLSYQSCFDTVDTIRKTPLPAWQLYDTQANMTSNGTKDEQGDVTSFLTRAVGDLVSQAGRIAPDVQALRDIAMTAFSGGIVDDHKYIVCVNAIESNKY